MHTLYSLGGTVGLASQRRSRLLSRISDFRNILNNLQLEFGSLSCFVELQVHHAQIYALNEAKHAHDHLDYWRAVLAGSYNRDLDSFLERTLTFLEEIQGNPVLLSMLVLCLKTQKPGGIKLPTNVLQLYEMAIEGALEEQGQEAARALPVLRRVASANMLATRRVFTSKDTANAAGSLEAWMSLSDSQGAFPLIKILEEGESPEHPSSLGGCPSDGWRRSQARSVRPPSTNFGT
jgi:hypothetical protein